MPYFDPDESLKFFGDAGKGGDELDLRGLTCEEALRRLNAVVIPVNPGQTARLRIHIDPPIPGGGETLFQPLARHLLAARRRRHILHFLPVHPDGGAGFIVERLIKT